MQARSSGASSLSPVAPIFQARDAQSVDDEAKRRAIGRRLAEARKAAGLSQEDLATKVGVRSGTISRYERGAFQPRTDKLEPIVDALGVSSDWIFRGVQHEGYIRPALQRFLDTAGDEDVTAEEKAELASFQPNDDAEPTAGFYGALLLLIRSGMKRSLEARPSNDDHETSTVRETRKAAAMRVRKTPDASGSGG